ncbi:MAG: DUF4230 domain-containing protein [Pedosphaera sp.]|nr:DUF4230 domain-containing protein [Pedosphaera sp.]
MQKLRPLIALVVLVMIFVIGLWLGFIGPRWLGFGSSPRIYGTATVLQQVQTLSEFVTVKYVMEKVVILEDVKWYPGGDSRVLLVAHGVVKAGMDLKQMKSEDVRISGKKISIRLPPAQITDAFLDEKQTRVIERTTGVLRLFDKDFEQTARQTAVDDIRRAARTTGILKDAEDRARGQVKILFLQMGFEQVEFLSN